MNWDDLRIFNAVAQTGNVTRAAHLLKINAATVGRRISRLERDLDTQLFAKSPTGYLPTPKGLDLIEHTKRIQHECLSIQSNSIPNADTQLHGIIRVAAPDGCATFILPQVFAEIMAENPGLELEIVTLSRSNDLLRRDVDIIIDVKPHGAKAVQSEWLSDYKLIVAIDSQRLKKYGNNFDRNQHPFVGYIEDLLLDPSLSSHSWAHEAHSKLSSNSIAVQWNWIRQGYGVGFVHDFAFFETPTLNQICPELEIERSYYISKLRSTQGIDHLSVSFELLKRRLGEEFTRRKLLNTTK